MQLVSAGDVTEGPRRRGLWPGLSLLPFGLGAWAPVIAGVRCGVLRWTLLGLFWTGLWVGGVVLDDVGPKASRHEGAAALLLFGAWVGAIVTSFAIRRSYEQRIAAARVERAPWPEPTARSGRWSVRYALIAYVVAFGGVNALAGLLYLAGIHFQVGVGALLVDAFLLATLLPLRRRVGLSRQDLGLRGAPAARSIGLVALAVAAYAAFAAFWTFAVLHSHSAKDPFTGVKHESTINIALAVVAAAASAPVVEEIFFRGFLYRSLRNRFPVGRAALIAGVLFGAVHITVYPVTTLPALAAFGVIACLLYERTGSLLPGIALHSFVDASGIDNELTGNATIVLVCFGVLIAVLLVRASAGRRRTAAVAAPA